MKSSYLNFKTLLKFCNNFDIVSDDPYIRATALREIHAGLKFPYATSNGPESEGSFLITRHCPDYFFYFDNFELAKDKQQSEVEEFGQKISVTPDDPEYSECQKALQLTLDIYRTFLTKTTKGILDLDQLELFANECYVKNFRRAEFFKTDNEFEPLAWLTPKLMTFEDIIETFSILVYFFNRRGNIFSYVKKCKHCDVFFLPANPKAFFCTEKCRGRVRYLIKTGRIVEK